MVPPLKLSHRLLDAHLQALGAQHDPRAGHTLVRRPPARDARDAHVRDDARRVRKQHALDLDGRHLDPGHLERVFGAVREAG